MSKTTNKCSPEVRERATRLVLDSAVQHKSPWSAIVSISSKIGEPVEVFSPQEFANYFATCGYDADQSENTLKCLQSQ